MRLFLSSVPEELHSHRAAALEVARELGFSTVWSDPLVTPSLDPASACQRQMRDCDLMLAIVGWRCGPVPSPEAGGDGLRPWLSWELDCAFEQGLPVTVLMAAKTWRPELVESDGEARALMRDLRGELARVAVLFEDEPADPDGSDASVAFRALVERRLAAMQIGAVSTFEPEPGGEVEMAAARLQHAELRRWPPQRLPEWPYPALLPYAHPRLLAGRERELGELRQRLRQPLSILGLYAPSGTGKSSLLAGGLVAGLRAEGLPVAFVRHPAEAGLAGLLIGDLLEVPDLELDDHDLTSFVAALRLARRLAGDRPPVLVLDQFEDVFHRAAAVAVKDGAFRRAAAARRARATVGALLAASIQRLPGLDGPLCHWLLAYRQELHGEVFLWLQDALREARAAAIAGVEALPHDLAGTSRFNAWPLPPLASSLSRRGAGREQALEIFRAAIERPLELRDEAGRRCFPWRFVDDGAARLAAAFADARARRPQAPLAPELQVVLAYLLERAPLGVEGERRIEVPEDPGELIDRALEDHLIRALDFAFPMARGQDREVATNPPMSVAADGRILRTRALLALRELADASGRRKNGLPADLMARALGSEGREVLAQLATPTTRLVLLQEEGDGWCYVLSHDRLAEIIVRWVDREGGYPGLEVDHELLGLRRFVALQSELFAAGEVAQATEVQPAHFRRIEAHTDVLLWGPERQEWWRACQRRWRQGRLRRRLGWSLAMALVLLVAVLAWRWADRRALRETLLEQVATGAPDAAFAAFDQLTGRDFDVPSKILLTHWLEREKPCDLFERGLDGIADDRRGAALVAAAELAIDLIARSPDEVEALASLLWGLDLLARRDHPLADRAWELREKALAPLRQQRPPPPYPAAVDAAWSTIPAGEFWMGTAADAGREEQDMWNERPRHRVMLSSFRMQRHEVTNAEYRRLVPEHAGEDLLPATSINWYEAYVYAAWRGGRLPTEAEWEYAARAGCRSAYCRRDGSATSLDEVAWWLGTTSDPPSRRPLTQPVAGREPNPWGLHDLLGNAWEWTADWYGEYGAEVELDPTGPVVGQRRVIRGGSVWNPASVSHPARRIHPPPIARDWSLGFRLVLDPEHRPSPADDREEAKIASR